MKISATSSGGFAGLGEHYEIDTQHSAAGKALEAALADTGFFSAPGDQGEQVIGADIPRWSITVSSDGQRQSVSFAEDGSPASARWQNLLAQIRAAN